MAVLGALAGCKSSSIVVGEFKCSGDDVDGGDPIGVPWETSFENGFCDYQRVAGSCYRFPPVSFRLVDYPVHSGKYAAEITVVTRTDGGAGPQGRCHRDGVLPVEAYYGAWYFLPKTATVLPTPAGNPGLWNLFHFGGGPKGQGLWDVSLFNSPSGDLILRLYCFLNGAIADSSPIPIGRWFHVVFYLKRAKDKTGAAALYLDGQKVAEFTNLITDNTDSGQWYAGNLADAVDPPECTVYMDDVTIRSTL